VLSTAAIAWRNAAHDDGERLPLVARRAPLAAPARTLALEPFFASASPESKAGRDVRPKMSAMRKLLLTVLAASLVPAAAAPANTSHKGWPKINGMLLMNKTDRARPLDARPGQDPFAHTDPRYSCDAVHLRGKCQRRLVRTPTGAVVTTRPGHNELLGGHGNDTIYAGPWGDVLWADYKPSHQPSTQTDTIFGGPGRDFIYTSHGTNNIAAGAGDDWVKAHFGRGAIDCGPGRDLLFISRRAQRHFRLANCERISHRTLGR
jgi:RTX calcium-binding nonapeptide repeat (4 copies)